MTKLPIIFHPNDILRIKSVNVKASVITSSELQQLIRDMKQTMLENKGIGLAAPQVGKNIRLFVVSTKDETMVFVNPKILYRSLLKETSEEGCLSIPGVFGQVKRSKSIRVSALDENGKKFTLKAKGLLARVILHETDHIDGILFIDRAKKITEGKDKLNNVKKL